ncbi:PepSY domain-containing protein [Aquabacterium sp.]|uniref:PepSY domain-containing protein n=1 Tax=Aquabacterium sp. TaxID=1872578 RepID=UPI002489F13B|nr:PepSY domain-containing protein [Aquabacterium sp.]MDI1259865.1 PepSY domain-containing protein [Aquabacterium sp.]
MKASFILSLALFVAAPTLVHAHGDFKCSEPTAEWKKRDELVSKLEKEGWKIRKIKVDNGCYEVYGFDKQGNKKESYFNPKTLELMGNVVQ